MSRGPVPDPYTCSLEVRYRTPSQSYEDCLGVREYITMDIYWIISFYFREILFCEYEIHLTFHTMDIYWIISLYFREILFCEYEIHLTFHTYQTKQTDIIKQWQLIMVSLQLKPDIILGLRWNHVIEKCNHWNNIETTSEQIQCCRPIRRT